MAPNGHALALLLIVHLHHVDTGKVLLHLLTVLDTLSVDDIVDVLDFVRAHRGQVRLRRRAHTQDRLIDRRELVVLISARRDKALRSRVTTLLLRVLALTNAANFR